jgi:hypothetical protein
MQFNKPVAIVIPLSQPTSGTKGSALEQNPGDASLTARLLKGNGEGSPATSATVSGSMPVPLSPYPGLSTCRSQLQNPCAAECRSTSVGTVWDCILPAALSAKTNTGLLRNRPATEPAETGIVPSQAGCSRGGRRPVQVSYGSIESNVVSY